MELILTRVMVALLFVLLAAHARADGRKVGSFVCYLWARLRVLQVSWEATAETPNEEKFRKMLLDVKLKNLHLGIDGALLVVVPALLLWLVWLGYTSSGDGTIGEKTGNEALRMLYMAVAVYGVLLFMKFYAASVWGSGIINVHITLHTFNALYVLRLASMGDAKMFFSFASFRMVACMLLGMVTLEPVQSSLWGIVYGVVHLHQHMHFARQIKELETPVALLALSQFFQWMFFCVVLYVLHSFVVQRLRDQIERAAFASETSGVRSLLAVLCDAHVQLGADLRITGANRPLTQLLTMSSDPHTESSLNGTEFTKFMPEAEQSRFQMFLDSTVLHATAFAAESTKNLPGPPGSLNVHLRDSSGVLFDAELFHVYLQDLNGEPAHLIGICEGQRDQKPVADAAIQDELPLPTAMTLRNPSSSSSRSSRSTFRGAELPQTIEVKIDPFTTELTTTSCTLSWNVHQVPPQLLQFVAKRRSDFLDWLQSSINSIDAQGTFEESRFESVQLLIGPKSRVQADAILTSLSYAADADDSHPDCDSESGEDSCMAIVKFENFRLPQAPQTERLPSIREA